MQEGKLAPELLQALLAELPPGEQVILGPGLGHDGAVVQLADRFLVLASDPVSFAAERIGWYAVHVNANDVACLGAAPRWFLATVLLPPQTAPGGVEAIFDDLRSACAEVGAALVGGHTEISGAVTQPVVVGTMVGEAPSDRLYRSDAAQPGDALLQVGAVAIEGTALLAREAPDRLRAAGLSETVIAEAVALLFQPGISVLRPAQAVWGLPGVHTLHDPTEGGIATACWEVAEAASLGVTVYAERIILHPLTERVAAALPLDPLGLLASGSLLVTVDAAAARETVRDLHKAGLATAVIGRIEAQGAPAILENSGGRRPLPRFSRDEVARILARDP